MPPPCRVLIVDDNDALREMLTWLLEDEGYRVTSAARGGDVLQMVNSCQEVPDVMLLDFNLPDMTAQEVRAAQRT